jgi:spore coat polysaccharide biosynthesis predicted glycosyltransferase SpsG
MAIALNRRALAATKTALFRVDAGPGIGMGHFMRCRTLALELVSRNWVVFFAGHGLPEDMLNSSGTIVRYNAINLVRFEDFSDSEADVKQLQKLVDEKFADSLDCLIIDTYRYTRDDFVYLQRFNRHHTPVVIIDDMANRDTPAQAVINPNPLFNPEPYERQKIPHILCGENYTLIRPEIVRLRNRPFSNAGPLMITLGGGNVVPHLQRILAALPSDLPNQVCVSVSGNCPLEWLEQWISQKPQQRFLNTDSNRFPELLASSGLAITGGGTTLWEVYCLGIPSLGMVWIDNQKHTTEIIKEQATIFLVDIVANINVELKSDWLDTGLKTMVKHLGHPLQNRGLQQQEFTAAEVIAREKTSVGADNIEVASADFIRQSLARLILQDRFTEEMMARQRNLIDGQGARRCAEALDSIRWQDVALFPADYRRSR